MRTEATLWFSQQPAVLRVRYLRIYQLGYDDPWPLSLTMSSLGGRWKDIIAREIMRDATISEVIGTLSGHG